MDFEDFLTTPSAQSNHQTALSIFHCLPWLGIGRHTKRFPRPKQLSMITVSENSLALPRGPKHAAVRGTGVDASKSYSRQTCDLN